MTKRGPSHGGEAAVSYRRRLTGRRRGRRLRPGLQRLFDELLPRVSFALPENDAPLDLSALFGWPPGRLWLEIGFGSGEHLAWQAVHNPGVAMIGAEIYINGIASLLRSVDEEALTNLRVFQGDGRDLLDVLPEASFERVFALFADPWPKERHHKRRLIQDETLDRFARVMEDGAELRLATDHDGYLRWMVERACRHATFDWLAEGPGDWRERSADWPPTRYEEKAIEQGRRPVYLRFRRRYR